MPGRGWGDERREPGGRGIVAPLASHVPQGLGLGLPVGLADFAQEPRSRRFVDVDPGPLAEPVGDRAERLVGRGVVRDRRIAFEICPIAESQHRRAVPLVRQGHDPEILFGNVGEEGACITGLIAGAEGRFGPVRDSRLIHPVMPLPHASIANYGGIVRGGQGGEDPIGILVGPFREVHDLLRQPQPASPRAALPPRTEGLRA